MSKNKQEAIKKLQTLRNIGSITAERLYSIGIKTPQQMKQSDPEELYEKLKKRCGGKLDRCVLYQFRGAVLDIPWPKCKNLGK
ncbi:MAG: TfoX/Sxy family DNA transformation protein [Candidatus Omnitrophica bacterium]|nr:TfoX/Sxy family DNA transformation protein [Candidatus Omnitrophota bacterium]